MTNIFNIGLIILAVAIVLWAVILFVFVITKIRNVMQRKKYSVKQDGDVTTEYHTRGLQ